MEVHSFQGRSLDSSNADTSIENVLTRRVILLTKAAVLVGRTASGRPLPKLVKGSEAQTTLPRYLPDRFVGECQKCMATS
jgi:hypothetical protein